jgi:periplasmic divalent cation tolerance protein
MTEFLSVYMTAPTRDEADEIARVLVEEGLAACATIFWDVTSVYRWQGKVEQAQECVIIVKTLGNKFDALQKRVKEIHSYDCPCIVATVITTGNPDYLEWLSKAASSKA